jgi:hypothetical protein
MPGIAISPGFPGVVDSKTEAHASIPWEHYEIHDGDSYEADNQSTALASGDKINICFQTPNTSKRIHAYFVGGASGLGSLYLLEGVTFTTPSGSALAPRNRDRNSANTSTLSDITGASNSVTKNGTLATTGTEIVRQLVPGSGRVSGGESRSEDEFILKQNTKYAVVFEAQHSGGGNIAGSLQMNWYEL